MIPIYGVEMERTCDCCIIKFLENTVDKAIYVILFPRNDFTSCRELGNAPKNVDINFTISKFGKV